MDKAIEKLIAEYGFEAGTSGGGCMWFTKPTTYKGKPAFIAITDESGCRLPESLDSPIMVGIHDLEGGEISETVKDYPSLKSYFDTIQ